MTFGCATTPARPGNGVIATLRNERGAAWRVKDTRRPPFWAARPARCQPAHWHPRGGGHADGYLSPPAGTAPAPMTCGKLHILCAPPAAPDTRTRTKRHADPDGASRRGEGRPGWGTRGRRRGRRAGSGPDDPGPSAAPEDAGDARGSGPGAPARRVGPPARTRARIRPTTRTTSPSRSRRRPRAPTRPRRPGGPRAPIGREAREREREGPEPLGLSRLRACARRARGGTRTPMIVRSHGPEPCASTNSATRARSEADDSRSGPPASNQSDPQTGETRHPPDPSAPPPHPPGHTGYDGPDGSVPAEEPVILGGEEHGVPGQVREGR